MLPGMQDDDGNNIPGNITRSAVVHMDDVIGTGAPPQPIQATNLNHHFFDGPDIFSVSFKAYLILPVLKTTQSGCLHLFVNLIHKGAGPSAGSVRVFKGERAMEANFFKKGHGVFKVLVFFPGETDNNIGC